MPSSPRRPTVRAVRGTLAVLLVLSGPATSLPQDGAGVTDGAAAPAVADADEFDADFAADAAPDEDVSPLMLQPPIDSGDTAWVLVCSALVLLMTIPGLALFYGGLVRRQNVLGVMMQCVGLSAVMAVVWVLWGYSLAFGGVGGFIGDGSHLLLEGVHMTRGVAPVSGTIPTLAFMAFQGMFFAITPALICGAYAERMKFGAACLFSVLWGTFVYCPIAHWVWCDGGWLLEGEWAALDFAGGTVVHVSSGVSALVACLLIGKRMGYPRETAPPHNLTYTVIGTALLWFGWFGFNAGSALAANGLAASAFVVTHLGAAGGALGWAAVEWIVLKRPTILGACTGAVAGLVCVTPAAGFVQPVAGILLGIAAGVVCYVAVAVVKGLLKYDDSLDAFGVHGVGGAVGALLTGVFATTAVNPAGADGLLDGNAGLVLNQLVGVLAAGGYAAAGSAVILLGLKYTVGLRVGPDDEQRGLDVSQHGEEGYLFQ